MNSNFSAVENISGQVGFKAALMLILPNIFSSILWVITFKNPDLGFSDQMIPVYIIIFGFSLMTIPLSYILIRKKGKSVVKYLVVMSVILGSVFNLYGFLWGLGTSINVL